MIFPKEEHVGVVVPAGRTTEFSFQADDALSQLYFGLAYKLLSFGFVALQLAHVVGNLSLGAFDADVHAKAGAARPRRQHFGRAVTGLRRDIYIRAIPLEMS